MTPGEKKTEVSVEVLYFEGCPNHMTTVERVREALRAKDLPDAIREIEVRTQFEAEALAFLGSPTVRINGKDIEPDARSVKTFGLSCRTYMDGGKRIGMPSRHIILRAIDEQPTSSSSPTPSNLQNSCCQIGSAAPITQTSSMPAGTLKQASSHADSGVLLAGSLAAILASACCLGPLVLVALGISGAWIGNLTLLEPYRPLFIAGALVALFFAGRRIFRSAHGCKPGDICAFREIGRAYRFVFWTSGVLVLVALVFPYVAKLFY